LTHLERASAFGYNFDKTPANCGRSTNHWMAIRFEALKTTGEQGSAQIGKNWAWSANTLMMGFLAAEMVSTTLPCR
jgi:hypothetical protein